MISLMLMIMMAIIRVASVANDGGGIDDTVESDDIRAIMMLMTMMLMRMIMMMTMMIMYSLDART